MHNADLKLDQVERLLHKKVHRKIKEKKIDAMTKAKKKKRIHSTLALTNFAAKALTQSVPWSWPLLEPSKQQFFCTGSDLLVERYKTDIGHE